MAHNDNIDLSEKNLDKLLEYLSLPIKFLDSKIDLELEKSKNHQIGHTEALFTFIGILISVLGFVYESVFKVTEVVKKICIGAYCNDGWFSESVGRGTCSWHNGIHHYVYRDIVTHYRDTYEMVYVFFLVLIILFAGYRCFINDSVRKSLVSQFLLSFLFISKNICWVIFLPLTMLLIFLVSIPKLVISIPKILKFLLFEIWQVMAIYYYQEWWKFRNRKLLKKKSNFKKSEILKLITFGPLRLEGCDFEKSDLSNLDLSRACLSGANLTDANLSGANLTKTNLSTANLTRANLEEAGLEEANLTGANLSEAYLAGANLTGANLSGAYLTRVNLSEADLTGANLSGADFTEANLIEANLTGANLSENHLIEAFLRVADFTPEENITAADLSGVYFTGVNLAGANLTGVNLSGVNLSLVNLSLVNLSGADLSGADLTGVDLAFSDLTGADLSGADLTGADLTGVTGYNP